MTDMNMRANATLNFPGRTYRFYNGTSIYEFGHGLSYSTFSKFIASAPSTILIKRSSKNHQNNTLFLDSTALQPNGQAINVSSINCLNLKFEIGVGVKNGGPVDGTHVVLVFWKPPSSDGVVGMPILELIAFERVAVKRGKTETVKMELDVCKRLSVVDREGKRKVVLGQHTLLVGSSSERQVRHHFNIRLAQSEGDGGVALDM